MLFFQQSSVVDKNLGENDIRMERLDTALGALLTIVVAVICGIVTGTLLKGVDIEDAAQAARLLIPINKYVVGLMAFGLFDAGLLGAIAISLASSWAWGEVFGWPHSLNHNVKQAPWFHIVRLLILVIAGGIVLIPGAPLVLITLFVQVIAVTLLPAALIFLVLLLNSDEVSGKYKNTVSQNIILILIVSGIIIMSTLYGLSTVFPNLFQ
jgi:Mn2+/Fe2+ NRAMP family transporter